MNSHCTEIRAHQGNTEEWTYAMASYGGEGGHMGPAVPKKVPAIARPARAKRPRSRGSISAEACYLLARFASLSRLTGPGGMSREARAGRWIHRWKCRLVEVTRKPVL